METYCMYIRTYTFVRRTHLEPVVHDVLYQDELLLPLFDLHFKGLDEGGAPHGLCLDNVVIQEDLNVIHC